MQKVLLLVAFIAYAVNAYPKGSLTEENATQPATSVPPTPEDPFNCEQRCAEGRGPPVCDCGPPPFGRLFRLFPENEK